MIRSARLASIVLLAAVAAPYAIAAHTHMPTPRTWTFNLKESNYGGVPAPKSESFVMLTDTEKWAKYTDIQVDAEGKTWKSSWSGPADGTAKPIVGIPGATFSSNAATDVSVMVMPDGMVQTCDFSLSADKKKFIEDCVAKTKDGKTFKQHIVFDRTK